MNTAETNTTNDVIITARAKAFAGQGVRNHKVLVEPSGSVRVWDDVAGHYTTCHSLSASAERRLRKLAKLAAE
ncbi:MAG TPA: hypothetical protein PL064_10605 [Thermogutta sp.]|mgnify:CR=1 FL=1|nr:hypothetical protein [Thermogutta sp.]